MPSESAKGSILLTCPIGCFSITTYKSPAHDVAAPLVVPCQRWSQNSISKEFCQARLLSSFKTQLLCRWYDLVLLINKYSLLWLEKPIAEKWSPPLRGCPITPKTLFWRGKSGGALSFSTITTTELYIREMYHGGERKLSRLFQHWWLRQEIHYDEACQQND